MGNSNNNTVPMCKLVISRSSTIREDLNRDGRLSTESASGEWVNLVLTCATPGPLTPANKDGSVIFEKGIETVV